MQKHRFSTSNLSDITSNIRITATVVTSDWTNNNTSYIVKWQDYVYDLTNSMEQSPSSEDNNSLAVYRLSL
jgi:hypothetical protein